MRTLQWVTIVVAATCIAIAACAVAQAQQRFPTKPIRLVTGAPAGNQTDTLARLIGQKMSESWGQPVVVENRPGAGGMLAVSMVAKAPPDGYTLAFSLSFSIIAALQPSLPYDPLKDFVGVSQLGSITQVLSVAPSLDVKSVKDLIALARAQPGKIIYSSGSAGQPSHLNGARFQRAAGIKVVNVAFRAGSEALIETLAGRTHYCFSSLAPLLPFVQDKKLVALAVTTPQRSPVLPDVPALAEMLPEFKKPESSVGLLAPAKTPRSVLSQISQDVARVLSLPDIREKLHGMGLVPAPTTPEEYDRILRGQVELLSKLVVDIGLKMK